LKSEAELYINPQRKEGMSKNIEEVKTDRLWNLTNSALHGQDWTTAIGYLDDLMLRDDYYDHLLCPESYGMSIEHLYYPILADRIGITNAKANSNALKKG
jgi:hypothetical protein